MVADWSQPYPSPGDFVWCFFPNVADEPTMKSRPALVVAVDDSTTQILLRVAYATTKLPTQCGRGSFSIIKPDHLRRAGLSGPTKVKMDNIVVLPYNDHNFKPVPLAGGLFKPTPVMGSLHPELMKECQRAAEEAGLLKRPRPSRSR